jgi:3-hydroxyisobutyrate dehydrogenase-like beta-hydroxyacid dehydrogenase
MARAIIDAGFETTLWARRAVSLEPYADTSANVADSPAGLAKASNLICLCVVADDDVRTLAAGREGVLAGAQPGSIIVVHSTVHPDTSRKLAERASARGVSVIDAPASGGATAVAQRQLLVMVGGDEAAVNKCRPVFATYGDPIVHLGSLGSGQITKILNNLLLSANLGSAMSLLELSSSLGLSRNSVCEVIAHGSAKSMAMESLAAFGASPEELAKVAGALLLRKDVRLAVDIARSATTPHGLVFDAADAALDAIDHPR